MARFNPSLSLRGMPAEPIALAPEPAFTAWRLRNKPCDRDSVGMRRLWAAILKDALDCFYDYRDAKTGPQREAYEDARSWIFRDDHADWLSLSFADVCDRLDLDYRAVRTSVAAWADRETKAGYRRPRAKIVPIRHDLYHNQEVAHEAEERLQARG